jgi:hypothetical protein
LPVNSLSKRARIRWCECPDCLTHARRQGRERLLLAAAGAVLAAALILPSLF